MTIKKYTAPDGKYQYSCKYKQFRIATLFHDDKNPLTKLEAYDKINERIKLIDAIG